MWEVERHLAFMDKMGIETSVLTLPAPLPLYGDREKSREIVRKANRAFHDIRARYPGRFLFCASLPLPDATSDTLPLLRAARAGLEQLFRPGLAYAKAGVMLYGLEAADRRQGSLLSTASPAEDRRRQALMRALDAINGKFGRESIFFGAQGLGEADWHMRQAHRSPRLTTRWNELPQVRC